MYKNAPYFFGFHLKITDSNHNSWLINSEECYPVRPVNNKVFNYFWFFLLELKCKFSQSTSVFFFIFIQTTQNTFYKLF